MKVIGIITRPIENKQTINKEISNMIISNNCLPLGIIVPTLTDKMNNFKELKKIIDICDGFILQGGENFYEYDTKIVKYLYKKNIPTLGICLGMQTMSYAFNGKIDYIKNSSHNSILNYVHYVNINKNSKLYNILKEEQILVNSRHKEYIVDTYLEVSAKCDNIIEAVEDKNKKFFIGVEWHPESISNDKNQKKLIEAFFNSLY